MMQVRKKSDFIYALSLTFDKQMDIAQMVEV